MGTPQFSVPTFNALLSCGHQIVAVYSQPPRKAGRGKKIKLSPVQAVAEEKGFLVQTPTSLRPKDVQNMFRALELDVAIVVAYGLILPPQFLEVPKFGCLNIHASLLPRWRGAAPIQRAMLAGDTKTGVTIMQMDKGLDTGPMLMQENVHISSNHTKEHLETELSILGADLIVKTLSELLLNRLKPILQPDTGVTYAEKLTKQEGKINWTRTSSEIHCQVRALNPWPGTWFHIGKDRIRLLKSQPVDGSGVPGTVRPDLSIVCGKGALKLELLQRPGKSILTANEFLNGYKMLPGSLLE